VSPTLRLTLFILPLLLLGIAAGALRAMADLHHLAPPRRRLLGLAWVLTLLCGAPAWLVVAALLGLW
jgi:hypothetical protein